MLNRRRCKLWKVLACCLMVMTAMPNMVWGASENTEVAVESETNTDAETSQDQTTDEVMDPVETNQLLNWPQGSDINSGTACLMDADTGAVLYNKKMFEKMYPASTTKVMTVLVALENAQLDEKVVFTETGVAEAYSGSSNLYTQVGEEFTVEDCLYALMLKSANDFASQIAEHVGGSVEAFCQMMNEKAASLGCVNTNFNNAHGMPDENHYSCAYDLALIMREAIKNETFCKIAATQSYVIPATSLTAKRTITSHNGLIMEGDHYYEECFAGKTGYTDSARCTFVSAAKRGDKTLVECTMFSNSAADSFVNAKALYEYGFNNFTNYVVQEAGSDVYSGGSVTLPNGITPEGVEIAVEVGEKFSTVFGNMIHKKYLYDGHQVGYIAISEETYLEEQRLLEEAQAKMEEEQRKEQERLDDIKNTVLQEPSLEPISDELFTPSHIVIGVFIILIGLGIIAIVITLVVKSIRRKRRRRRRQMRRRSERE